MQNTVVFIEALEPPEIPALADKQPLYFAIHITDLVLRDGEL
jgi:hypothetical protein